MFDNCLGGWESFTNHNPAEVLIPRQQTESARTHRKRKNAKKNKREVAIDQKWTQHGYVPWATCPSGKSQKEILLFSIFAP